MSDIKINGNVIWGCLRREFASPACFLFNYVHVKGLYFDEYLKEYPNSAFDRDSASAIFREMWSYLKKCFPSKTEACLLEIMESNPYDDSIFSDEEFSFTDKEKDGVPLMDDILKFESHDHESIESVLLNGHGYDLFSALTQSLYHKTEELFILRDKVSSLEAELNIINKNIKSAKSVANIKDINDIFGLELSDDGSVSNVYIARYNALHDIYIPSLIDVADFKEKAKNITKK